jgi:hypothetical protein
VELLQVTKQFRKDFFLIHWLIIPYTPRKKCSPAFVERAHVCNPWGFFRFARTFNGFSDSSNHSYFLAGCPGFESPGFILDFSFSRDRGRWPKVTHGPAHFLYALEVRDICNTKLDDTRATNASWSACQMQFWRANVTRMRRRCHAYVVQMRRASFTRHSSSKCDVKRAGCAHYTRCTQREKRAS